MASLLQRCFFLLAYLAMIQVCSGGEPNSAEKMRLDLYYESLTSYCAYFIVNLLPTIFKNGLIDIVDLHFVPWGTAQLHPNNTFTCEFKEDECLLNTVEACTIQKWPNTVDQFNIIYCIENDYIHWDDCIPESSFDSVTACYYKGKEGHELELKYANETASLMPAAEFYPWVVVDGIPLAYDYDNFVDYICKAYKGPLPSACKKYSYASVSKKKTNQAQSVTYKEEITKVHS